MPKLAVGREISKCLLLRRVSQRTQKLMLTSHPFPCGKPKIQTLKVVIEREEKKINPTSLLSNGHLARGDPCCTTFIWKTGTGATQETLKVICYHGEGFI